jgi:hypothetical protein
MNHKKNDLGFPILLGIFGFFWAGGLSLAAGNSVFTSLFRAALGLFGLFALGLLVRYAFRTFVTEASQVKEEKRGAFIDVALPEQKPGEPPSQANAGDAEFVPLANAVKSKTISDEEARKMAEALRHLDD